MSDLVLALKRLAQWTRTVIPSDADRLLEEAARLGHPGAQGMWAMSTSENVFERRLGAVKVCMEASKGCLYALGWICLLDITYGALVEHECGKSVTELVESAARAGNAYASYRLCERFLEEDADYYDEEKAFAYLELGAEQGHPYLQRSLGRVYMHGGRLEKDEVKALAFFKDAAADL